MQKPLLLAFAVFTLQFLSAQCSNGRYYNKIFQVESQTNVLYGNAMKFDSSYQDLKMNIYQPKNDPFQRRPLIVLAFGGSFTAGLKESPDILQLCDDFAKRGYVTATIDYRLGFEDGNDSDTNQFKALIRGVQDMKAAVRFFYKDASTINKYRIDTTQIFIGGVSAGGFIALNYAYGKLDTLSKPAPPFAFPAVMALGGPEGNSGNPGYSTKVKGVINLCGAIADTVWIMPNDPVLCGVHGTADDLVPCFYDSAQAAVSVEASLFGSGDIRNRCQQIGLPHSIYLFQGAGHVPFVLPIPLIPPASTYMDSTIRVVRDFLYQQVVCDSALISGMEDLGEVNMNVYPNPFSEVLKVELTNSNGDNMVEVFDVYGRLVAAQKSAVKQISINTSAWGNGMYVVKAGNAVVKALKE